QAEDGIRDPLVTGVQTCALPILLLSDGFLATVLSRSDRSRQRVIGRLENSLIDRRRRSLRGSEVGIVVNFREYVCRGCQNGLRRSEERRVGKEGRAGHRRDTQNV